MFRIQSYKAQQNLDPNSAFEFLRVERLVRNELLRSASISVGSMVTIANPIESNRQPPHDGTTDLVSVNGLLPLARIIGHL